MHKFYISAILSSVMKSCTVPLSPNQDVIDLFVQHLHVVYAPCTVVTY